MTGDAPEPGFAPGWHRDPANPGLQRYWDGQAWTDHSAPLVAPSYRPPVTRRALPRPAKAGISALSVVALALAVLVPVVHQVWLRFLRVLPGGLLTWMPDPLADAVILLPAPALALGVAVWALRRASSRNESEVVPGAAFVLAGLWALPFVLQCAFAMFHVYFRWFDWLFIAWW